ncbi:MAG: NnrS family protein [Rhodocyclales bacterium]|nr:NnrS family protein [Rhodocyclales bacterium]
MRLDDARRAPLLYCGFRPFYLATAAYAMVALLLAVALPMSEGVMGGRVAWHVHELIFGFALASIAGFLLTAIPEFTSSAPLQGRPLAVLFAWWLAARLGAVFADVTGLVPLAIASTGFILHLLLLVAAPAWRAPGRQQMGFVYALATLASMEAGYLIAAWRGVPVMPWLTAAVGVLMMLIVISMSRISLRLVNDALQARGGDHPPYLARPPRRNLATTTIALYTGVEFLLPGNAIGGWLALAAAAAMFNLLNDWHVGRSLFSRWVLPLYGVYCCIALGYALLGLSLLGGWFAPSAGRHLMLIGGAGLAMLIVMLVSGRTHSGHALDERRWVMVAIGMIITAALARTLWGLLAGSGVVVMALLAVALGAWIAAFALYLAHSWRVLGGPRPDGGHDCSAPPLAVVSCDGIREHGPGPCGAP